MILLKYEIIRYYNSRKGGIKMILDISNYEKFDGRFDVHREPNQVEKAKPKAIGKSLG